MSIITSIRKFAVPIHPEGYVFVAGAIVIALVLDWLIPVIGWIFWGLPLFCAYFFRDPVRVTPAREGLVISPADGKVSAVGYFIPPAEMGLGEAPMMRISIFLNVFDVHINRAPVGGKIRKIVYHPGLFLNADLDKASVDNERNSMVIETAHGNIGCVQIAGLIARRILCFVKEGQEIAPGARYGLIRFGSRTDIYIPGEVKALVAVGQRAIGGETILCDMKSAETQRQYRVS